MSAKREVVKVTDEIKAILVKEYPEISIQISEGFVFIFYKDNKVLNPDDANMLSYKETREYLVWLKNGNMGTFNGKDQEDHAEETENK